MQLKTINKIYSIDFFAITIFFVLLFYKSTSLSVKILNSFDLKYFLYLCLGDIQILGILLFFTLIIPFFINRFLKYIFKGILSLTITWYSLDTLLRVNLNSGLGLSEILIFISEIFYTNEGIILFFSSISLFLLIIFCNFLPRKIRARTSYALLAFSFLCQIFSLFSLEELKPYASRISLNKETIFGKEHTHYTEKELKKYNANNPLYSQIHLGPNKPNIILILVESLSAVDSFKTSGINNFYPKLDKISKDGTLFVNYFTNSLFTEPGLIGLLSGFPPIQYPGSSLNLYRSYENLEHITSKLPKEYNKLFFATSDLNFRGANRYIKKLHFNEIKDLTNEPFFQNAPKLTFKSPPDSYLYKYTLSRLKEYSNKHNPFFLILENTSSHLPYEDPLGKDNSEKNVLGYVDNQLFLFYQELKKNSFFDNGILIIGGDHRKMIPVSKNERNLYGGSADFRSLLLIIGNPFKKNLIDNRYLQQSDIFPFFNELSNPNKNLFTPIFLIEKYQKPLFNHSYSKIRVLMPELKNAHKPIFIETLGGEVKFLDNNIDNQIKRKISQQYHEFSSRSYWCSINQTECKN